MDSKVYYGEYSLRHWIDLILSGNITLPEYQRSFVWDEQDVKRLIKSLDDGQFVQPITIAHYNCDGEEKNLILDGQQRLTSLLLAYLGYIPDKDKFDELDNISSDDDSDEEVNKTKKYIGWTFEELLRFDISNNNEKDYCTKIEETGNYTHLIIKLKNDRSVNDFLESTFLGFSYIIPETSNAEEVQEFFARLFRNMNYLGSKLSPLESRRSLYYLNSKYKDYFEGITSDGKDVLCDIKILENMQSRKIDFVRYLSILSQYKLFHKEKKVLVGYSSYGSRENYYGDYVAYIVGIDQEDRPEKFDGFNFEELFPDNNLQLRFEILRNAINTLSSNLKLDPKTNAFTSWIDADYWLFGLIYWILFEGKSISINTVLISSISKEIRVKRKDFTYSKGPNLLGNLRERLHSSIEIYKKYVE